LTEGQALERINVLQKRIELIEPTVASESRSAFWWAAALMSDPSTNTEQRAHLSAIFETVLEDLTEFRGLANDWIASPEDLTQWSYD